MRSLLSLTLVVIIALSNTFTLLSTPEFSCSNVTEIPQIECEALIALYTSTDGDGWYQKTNWLLTSTPSDWYGVNVTDGHVSRLNFYTNGLVGELPPEIGNLTYLTWLRMSENYIVGSLPPEIGALTNLTNLYLSSNRLSGNVPLELGNLVNLVELELNNNRLTGSLDWLPNLTSLEFAYLGKNNLSGPIPPEIGNLVNLTWLNLAENDLSGSIPATLGSLTQLQFLELGMNSLTGTISLELLNLPQLYVLNLSQNRLTGKIPSDWSGLPNLYHLILADNLLTGSIPAELGNLTSLYALDLSNNKLTGTIPSSLSGTDLHILFLSSNQLTGDIPPELGSLVNLYELDLSYNQLSGTIPAGLGNPVHLYYLDLSNNILGGTIPSELGSSANMSFLHLEKNQLEGQIPAEIGNLANLYVLHLGDNHLVGDVPGTFLQLHLSGPGQGGEGQDGLDLDYNLINVPSGYPDPSDPLQDFLSAHDPNWQYFQGFTQIIGTSGGELISLDSKTAVQVPAGALDGDTSFTYIPHRYPINGFHLLVFAGNSFDLSANDAFGNPISTFNLPITVTLNYEDSDIPGFPESILALFNWDNVSAGWTDAVITCAGGEYQRDPYNNSLLLPVCHLTEFSLFGEPYTVLMPFIRR